MQTLCRLPLGCAVHPSAAVVEVFGMDLDDLSGRKQFFQRGSCSYFWVLIVQRADSGVERHSDDWAVGKLRESRIVATLLSFYFGKILCSALSIVKS
jgi:hypothetical protein